MSDTPDLTERQKELLSHLPASTSDLAEHLDISETTVETHRNAIQEKGISLEYDRSANQWYLADDRAPKLRRISTKHKQTKTREANEIIETEESILLRRLERNAPLTAPPREDPDSESFVAILGDLHFGDVVETDQGDVLYDMEAATDAVETFAEKVCRIKRLESEYTKFDDCHLILLGDLATGTHIYSGQVHDIEAFLAEQVTEATQALLDLVETLADAFATVQIHGVLGNHGLDRASAARGSNTDLIVYRWLDDSLRRIDVPNVSLNIAESTHHLNTTIRDWSVHVRHGQDGRPHVDKTSRSESDWRGWREKHRFDLAVRGHYHTPGLDWVLNRYPVISAPSPKPGGEFVERMGAPDVSQRKHLGWCVGVGDDRPLTFKRLIDDL
jgi:biotin operon repressor